MKAKIGKLFLVLGTGLFVAGAIGFMAGYLSQDQTVMFLVAPLASASDWQELLWRGYDPKGWLDRFLGMVMSTDPLVADEKVKWCLLAQELEVKKSIALVLRKEKKEFQDLK